MSGEVVCKRFFVSGRVQGVFFRGSTAKEAARLGISGSAVNLADGRVEVLATGSSAAVDQLAAWLQHGPQWARVDDVAEIVEDAAGLDVPAGFTTG
ncbi:MAG: acylphosphatase [Gammaproteobacteria bacterium]